MGEGYESRDLMEIAVNIVVEIGYPCDGFSNLDQRCELCAPWFDFVENVGVPCKEIDEILHETAPLVNDEYRTKCTEFGDRFNPQDDDPQDILEEVIQTGRVPERKKLDETKFLEEWNQWIQKTKADDVEKIIKVVNNP